MSSSISSEWSQLTDHKKPVENLVELMLATIQDILNSVIRIHIGTQILTEIGSYFYRASVLITDLKINPATPKESIEIIQLLSQNLSSAKGLVSTMERDSHSMQSSEASSMLQQLEDVIRSSGENINLIPASVYGNEEYVKVAAKSLSKEMKEVSFNLESKEKTSTKRKEKLQRVERDLYSIDAEAAAMDLEASPTSTVISTDFNEARSKFTSTVISTDFNESRSKFTSTIISTDFDEQRSKFTNSDYSKSLSNGSSSMALPHLAHYMEPLYETFFCPITKKVMDDPVTIDSGVTCERTAIDEWFDKFVDSKEIVCPKTGQKLKSRALSTNSALKATIDEWKERNEVARIKVARAALSLASTDNMVLEAIDDLRNICKSKPKNKVHVRSFGIIPLLANFLDYKSRSIRHVTLELLKELAEHDQEGKDEIAKKIDISALIRMLSSNHEPVRHTSVSLLYELSTSEHLCKNIGKVPGGILMLITLKYRKSSDDFSSVTADLILKNLERFVENIKLMAENGYCEPLLTHLLEGNEEMKMEMANYLGEIALGPNSKTYVAEKASPSLIQMVHSGHSLTRNAAFKALKQISSHHPNTKILIDAGILQIMIEEILTRMIHDEPMNSKSEAASILANVIESGLDIENIQVNSHGHTMVSDYILYHIVQRIKNSSPDELNINLIRILICLIKSPKASGTIVSVVKETEASYNLIELINNPNEELGVASIKLLIKLSGFMGHTLSDRLCKTKGQPENLIHNPPEITRIREKDAVSANFLAKLPHSNLSLNLALINSNTIPIVMECVYKLQMGGTRSSRHANSYFEGLVGIIVRLTSTLYDHQIVHTARTYNFASVLTNLLTRSFTDEVQKLSALGLENLSKQSIVLSRPPPPQRNKIKTLKFVFFNKCIKINLSKEQNQSFTLCPIHGGVCSSRETFCLIDAEAIDKLLALLDHQNAEVIEAALLAISTLLDDKVNVEKSISLLSEKRAIQQVLNVVKEHKDEAIWQKAFWVIERFLIRGGEESTSDISRDRLLPVMLVSAFHHGDDGTRNMAEKLLRHLNKMPMFSSTFTFTN